ncbi:MULTISPECIES: L,D-transpeptidase family protein [Sphingomonadaceae]|uniref:ErfK/YbiS/YcfS/YnhG family protein n=3 Tax=Sphingomonadaceae TaxID=41297 RepID=A0A081RIM9_SPHCR|nr:MULTISPECIES: L,D-transpeptidase family protein [Sphingomonadaceae]KEQ55052.1 ErfK/YbiS/YcfS/YnhG family protein precursor [Sphingobium chlorophenolicum]GEM70863.1 L,D-transpeptidase [Sphingomonas aquatilis NBRC 16722]
MLASVPEAPALTAGTVAQAAARLRPGQYLWAPQVAPSGPMIMVVNLRTQRATVYRNGIPIGITTVSSGRPGHETPPGVYTILQKEADHRSNLYNNAPMPFMQRLTWDGIALHGGALPGYPASHGCIRLPEAFARLLFAESRLGMMVVVTRLDTMPVMAATEAAPLLPDRIEPTLWKAEKRGAAALSVVVSTTDREVRVIRDGKEIGAAPVTLTGNVTGPVAYQRQVDGRWLRLDLPGSGRAVVPDLGPDVIGVDPDFSARVLDAAGPGTTVVVTPDRLRPELSLTSTLMTGNE